MVESSQLLFLLLLVTCSRRQVLEFEIGHCAKIRDEDNRIFKTGENMRLYRYRSIESALRDLREQSFYFASKEELNDPLERYLRLYWQGDKPAWEGLFKNYIWSLYQAFSLYLVEGDKTLIHKGTVVLDVHMFDNVPLGEVLRKIGHRFISIEQMQWLASFYGNNNLKCGTKELIFVLRLAHELAEKICIEDMLARKMINSDEGGELLSLIGKEPEKKIESLRTIEDENIEEKLLNLDETERRRYLTFLENAMEDIATQGMIVAEAKFFGGKDYLYKNMTDEKGNQARNWMSIKTDYPRLYVEQLKEVIFPKSYVVCFSTTNDNSAMWGNYADNHRGVCLIYESDDLMIAEYKENSSIAEEYKERPKYKKIRVSPVKYGGPLVERNFFESLGRLTFPQVREWLTGTEKISDCLDKYVKNREPWRQDYWDDVESCYHKKLGSWEHEKEYRIHIDNTLKDISDPKSRKFMVSPKSIKGIIFGINTSEYDMKQIFELIPSECWDKDADFEFYRAEYDDETMKIYIRKMTMTIKKTTIID